MFLAHVFFTEQKWVDRLREKECRDPRWSSHRMQRRHRLWKLSFFSSWQVQVRRAWESVLVGNLLIGCFFSDDDSLTSVVEFKVSKISTRTLGHTRRILCLSESALIERDVDTYTVINLKPLSDVIESLELLCEVAAADWVLFLLAGVCNSPWFIKSAAVYSGIREVWHPAVPVHGEGLASGHFAGQCPECRQPQCIHRDVSSRQGQKSRPSLQTSRGWSRVGTTQAANHVFWFVLFLL